MSETWPMAHGLRATYTEDHGLFAELLDISGVEKRATYSKDRREFGWDVMYHARIGPRVRATIRRWTKKQAKAGPA